MDHVVIYLLYLTAVNAWQHVNVHSKATPLSTVPQRPTMMMAVASSIPRVGQIWIFFSSFFLFQMICTALLCTVAAAVAPTYDETWTLANLSNVYSTSYQNPHVHEAGKDLVRLPPHHRSSLTPTLFVFTHGHVHGFDAAASDAMASASAQPRLLL